MLYITHKLIPFSTVLNFDIGSEDSIDLHSPFFSLYGLKSLNHPLEFPFIFNLGALTSIILLYLICTTKLTSLFFLNTFSHGKSQSKLQMHVHNNTVHSLPHFLHCFFFLFFLHPREPTPTPKPFFFFFNHQPYPLPPSFLPQEHRLQYLFEQTRTTLQEEKNKEKQQEHDDDEAQKEDGQEPTTDTRLITSFLRYAAKGFCPSFWFLTLPQ